MPELRKPVPDWLLERCALSLLPPQTEKQVLEALQQEPDGLARLEALKNQLNRERQEVLSAFPIESTLSQIQRRYENTQPAPALGRWVLAAASVAALFFLVWWNLPQERSATVNPGTFVFTQEKLAHIGERATVTLANAQIEGTVQPDQSVSLTQKNGSAKYEVSKNGKPFSVYVPSAKTTVSVRGTTFRVAIDKQTVRVDVEEGHVVVENTLGMLDVFAGDCVNSSEQTRPQKIPCQVASSVVASQPTTNQGVFEMSNTLKEATDPITKKKGASTQEAKPK